MDRETCRSLAGHPSHGGGGGWVSKWVWLCHVGAVVGEYFKFVV